MQPQKPAKAGNDAGLSPKGPEQTDLRNGFGDGRAAREDIMMADHAKQLREVERISEKMEGQLSKPRHTQKEWSINYEPEYLAEHPDYIGENHHDMPSYETALNIQNKKDAAKKKWLADWAAGKIDEWGKPISQGPASSSQQSSRTSDAQGNTTGGKRKGKVSRAGQLSVQMDGPPLSTSGPSGSAADKKSAGQDVQEGESPTKKQKRGTGIVTLRINLPPKYSESKSNSNPNSASTATTKTPTTTDETPSTAHHPSTPISAKPRRKRKSSSPKDPPLTPLHSFPDYQAYGYYELAAMCRERSIRSGGNVNEVRNTLIQDDINMAQGKDRDIVKTGGKRKRGYKTVAPEVPGVPVSSESRSSSGSGSSFGSIGSGSGNGESPGSARSGAEDEDAVMHDASSEGVDPNDGALGEDMRTADPNWKGKEKASHAPPDDAESGLVAEAAKKLIEMAKARLED